MAPPSIPPRDWLDLLSEPALVVTLDGQVVAYNRSLSRIVPSVEGRSNLQHFVEDDADVLTGQLHRWARNKQPIMGSLHLRGINGTFDATVYGGRLSDADSNGQPPHLLLRLVPRQKATRAFRTLNEKVDALAREVTARKRAEDEIRAERERLRITLASIGDAVLTTDADGRITFMNPVAEELTGWTMDEALGQPSVDIFAIVNETSRKTVESPVEQVMQEGTIVGLANHTVLIARDGTERPIEDSAAPIRDAAGNLFGIVLVFHDVSEKRQAEQALRESEKRFRTMADSAPVLIWLADENARCTYVNQQWLTFSGRRLEDELDMGWLDIVHPEDRDDCRAALRKAFSERRSFEFEYRLRRADGVYRWVLVHGDPRFVGDGSFVGYVGSCTDITDRYDAEQKLLSINSILEERVVHRTAQLRELTMRLTHTEQNERRRLAQMLHDNLQQYIVAASLHAESIDRQTPDPGVLESAGRIRELLSEALASSRSLTAELSPPILYESGFLAGLGWLARWMDTHYQLTVNMSVDEDIEPLDEEVKVQLFLAARELLFNVVKHSGVKRATVQVRPNEDDAIQLVIQDDGCGFDLDEMDDRPATGGFGLFSIRERVGYLGGQMDINTSAGQGTRIEIVLPREVRRMTKSPAS